MITPGAAESRARTRAILIGLCLALFAIVVWAFLPSLHNGFVTFDDDGYVWQNTQVQNGLSWESICWAFSTLHNGLWHPLTWLSHMLDCQLFGLRPGWHHLTSLLLHAANTVLLFVVLYRMTEARWQCGLVAALFGLHPLHVESVAWIAERKDVLSTCFFMLALWAYGRYVEKTEGGRQKAERGAEIAEIRNPESEGSPKSEIRIRQLNPGNYYALALGFFVCGLMSKPMLVTLPLVLLLLDYWPLRRWQPAASIPLTWLPRLLVIEKLPFAAAALVTSLITLQAASREGSLPSFAQCPITDRLSNVVCSVRPVLPANILAGRPGRVLSIPCSLCILGRGRRDAAPPGNLGHRGLPGPAAALCHCWLAVVPGHAVAGHRADSTKRLLACGSVHLRASDRRLHVAGLGCPRLNETLALPSAYLVRCGDCGDVLVPCILASATWLLEGRLDPVVARDCCHGAEQLRPL